LNASLAAFQLLVAQANFHVMLHVVAEFCNHFAW